MTTVTSLAFIYGVASVVALSVGFLLVLQAWEHRRYTRNKMREGEVTALHLPEHAAVIVPCKGMDLDLEDNLRRLLAQDYPSYEVIFVVDSENDPACELIRNLISDSPIPAKLVNAGTAEDCGQKIHNLIAATKDLDPRVKVLAFVDSDASPESSWLHNLAANLQRPNFDVVTSYRWFIPTRASFSNVLLCSINAAVMALTGSRRKTIVWGGTWAIRRDSFDRSGIRAAWHGRLSDDVVASDLFDRLGMPVSFEPRCIVMSKIDYNWADMWEFLRRQFCMGRWYRPRTWKLCFAVISLTMFAFWGGLFWSLSGLRQGSLWSLVPLAVTASLYTFAIVRAVWRQQAAQRYCPQASSEQISARWFDIAAFPLAITVVWCGMFASAVGRRIRWRGIEYEVGNSGRVKILNGARLQLVPADEREERRLAA